MSKEGELNAVPRRGLNRKFAQCGERQSGQRLLGSSDPRLIRHVASCETAGGGTHLPPAGKDKKLPREFEGGALIGREAPVPFSLDYSQTTNLLEFFRLLDRWDCEAAASAHGHLSVEEQTSRSEAEPAK